MIPASQMINNEIECATILNLNWVLAVSKVACANINTIRRIIQIIKESSTKVSLIVITNNNLKKDETVRFYWCKPFDISITFVIYPPAILSFIKDYNAIKTIKYLVKKKT